MFTDSKLSIKNLKIKSFKNSSFSSKKSILKDKELQSIYFLIISMFFLHFSTLINWKDLNKISFAKFDFSVNSFLIVFLVYLSVKFDKSSLKGIFERLAS
jgi:hypothetical protein